MERLSVLEARKLLHGAISASSAKETELQLMVGSRYHELIESADAIVLMHSTAAELRQRLHHLPESAQFLIQAQASKTKRNNQSDNGKKPSSTNNIEDGGKDGESSSSSSSSSPANENNSMELGKNEVFFRNIVSIPPRIWSALDEHRFFDAASALLEWPATFDHSNSNSSSFMKSIGQVPGWFHEFELYMDQFPDRITKDALYQLQQRQYNSSDYAGALVALSVINNNEGDTYQLLSQFLISRSKWISKGLDRFDAQFIQNDGYVLSELEWSKIVQKRLRIAVRSLRRTISDVQVLFLGTIHSVKGTDKAKTTTTSTNVNSSINVEKSMVISGMIKLNKKKYEFKNSRNKRVEGGCAVDEMVFKEGSISIDPLKVKKEVTVWFASEVRHIIDSSRQVLKGAHTASSLALIRQALWKESSHFESYGSSLIHAEMMENNSKSTTSSTLNDEKKVRGNSQKEEEGKGNQQPLKSSNNKPFSFKERASFKMKENPKSKQEAKSVVKSEYEQRGLLQWGLDCQACVDNEMLATLLAGANIRNFTGTTSSKSNVGNNQTTGGGVNGIDLWSLLFSRTFSDLGESLLHTSLRTILQDVSIKLDAVLGLIANKQHLTTASSSSSSSSSSPTCVSSMSSLFSFQTFNNFPSGHKSYELLYCSETIINDFEMKLDQLNKDASSLVQDGDQDAAEDLSQSLYLKSVEMISCFVNELRRKNIKLIQNSSTSLVDLKKSINMTTASSSQSSGIERSDNNNDDKNDSMHKVVNSIDGSLLIARISKVLISSGCKTLYLLLNNIPLFFISPHPDRISMEQLHAAFIVTDNNGDGELYSEECSEAIEGVLGCGHLLKLDANKMPTITLSEFALFATCILESAKPFHYLKQCCNTIFDLSYSSWSKDISQCLKLQLFSELNTFITSASQNENTFSETSWRCENGLWILIGEDSELFTQENLLIDDNEESSKKKRGSVYISEKVKGTRTAGMKHLEKEWQQSIGVDGTQMTTSGTAAAASVSSVLVTPGSISNCLQRYLFSASAELSRVVGLSDSIEGNITVGSVAHVDDNDHDSKQENHENVLIRVRSMFLKELMSCLASTYHEISLNVANLDACYEGAVFQLLADVLFLKSWIENNLKRQESNDNNSSSSSSTHNQLFKNNLNEWHRRFSNIEKALCVYVEPRLLELHRIHLNEVGHRFQVYGHVMLDMLLSSSYSNTATLSLNENVSSTTRTAELPTNIMQLTPSVRRFSLLPIPMDLIQSSSASKQSSEGNSNLDITSPSNRSDLFSSQQRPSSSQNTDESVMGGLLSNLRFKW